MAVAITFDTLDYARKLETAGVPAAQAELQATALGDALANGRHAAPADLVGLEGRLVREHRVCSTATLDAARIDSARGETVSEDRLARGKTVGEDRLAGCKDDAIEECADARIDTVKNELRLELGGKIDRLAGTVDSMKWMFGFVVALNIGILIRLLHSLNAAAASRAQPHTDPSY